MALHDSHYKHWKGRHRGIWRRRIVIAANGIRACLRLKFMRYLVTSCWLIVLLQASILFVIGQLLIPESIVVRWLDNLNPQLQLFAKGLVLWLIEHPEISVHTIYNLLFFFFTRILLTFSLIAVTLAIPHLITHDLGTNAIIVYSSKAIGRFDYFLGKFLTIFGLLSLTWLGPCCAAWFLGNLLATQWHFFWHSRYALGNTLLFVCTSMLILSGLSLGVSALSSREKSSSAIWIVLWLFGNALVGLAPATRPWIKFLSFRYNIDQISLQVFSLQDDLRLAQENIPVFGQMLQNMRPERIAILREPHLSGALWATACMLLLAAWIINRKVRPE